MYMYIYIYIYIYLCVCVCFLSLSLLVFQVCIIATKRHNFPSRSAQGRHGKHHPYAVRLVQTTSAGQAPPRESLNNDRAVSKFFRTMWKRLQVETIPYRCILVT